MIGAGLATGLGEIWEVLAGFALGCAVLYGLDRAVPHVHARFAEPGPTLDPSRRQALLLVSALRRCSTSSSTSSSRRATYAERADCVHLVLGGFGLMMFLDTVFG
jgi:hypothetical protein